MYRVQREPGVVEPLGQRECGAPVVIVEVIAHGEHLHRLEPMRGNLDQMVAVETVAEIEVRGDPEHHGPSL